MGGSSKKTTVGYKYFLGMDLRLCHGPVDSIRKIKCDDRDVWSGNHRGGSLYINKPELFGGEPREGGVAGTIDFDFGKPNQPQNSYLVQQLGNKVPAFRGVLGAIFRKCYLGNNPYLKKWSITPQRVFVRQDGIDQWYKDRAAIGSTIKEDVAIYLALDKSGSMDTAMSNGKTRFENMQDGVLQVLEELKIVKESGGPRVDIYLNYWGNADGSRSIISKYNADVGDINSLITFVNSQGTPAYGTYFDTAVMDIPAFFNNVPFGSRNIAVLITDGEPSDSPQAARDFIDAYNLSSSRSIDTYGINIDLTDTSSTGIVDDTDEDGVPVVQGNNSGQIASTILGAVADEINMNPAHIIRECLTDPDWGMGYPESDMSEASFQAAADKLHSEGLGMSLFWDRQKSIEDFLMVVQKHIDANLLLNPRTGLFELSLVRDDYDAETIPVLGESEIISVKNVNRPQPGELVNSVTVNYTNGASMDQASVTVNNEALIQMEGSVIATTFQYPGFTSGSVASRVALRELRTLSTPLLTCDVVASRAAADLNIGDVFKMTWPDEGINEMIVRVVKINTGDGKNNQVRLSVIEDVFTTPDLSPIANPDSESAWEDISVEPQPAERAAAFEIPYYDLVQSQGEEAVTTLLTDNPDAGYLAVAAGRPSGAFNSRFYVDSGAGYEDGGVLDFCSSAELDSDIDENQTEIQLTGVDGLDEVAVGTLALIGDEQVSVVSVDTVTGIVQFGRGVLDTPPRKHLAGTPVIFWDNFIESDEIEYVNSEEINVKVTPATGQGELAIDEATAETVLMKSRASLPYPPGDLKINGIRYPTLLENVPITASWVHRDRLQQTGGSIIDHTAAGVGPEANTLYRVRGYQNNVLLYEENDLDGLSATFQPDMTSTIRVEVDSVRDGYYSYSPAMVEFAYSMEIDEAAVSESILTKLRNWWPMDDTSGSTVLRDVHGGSDLLIENAANVTLAEPALASDAGTGSVRFDSTGLAKLYGMPTWMVQGADKSLAHSVFVSMDAVSTTGERYITSNALASDSSESINFQFRIELSTEGQFAYFWETGTGDNVTPTNNAMGAFVQATPDSVMLVANRDSALLTLENYVNGIKVGEDTYPSNPTGGEDANSHFIVGNQQAADGDFRGWMQNYLTFRQPLTSVESNWLYNFGNGRKYEDLLVLSGRGAKWTPTELRDKLVWIVSDDEHEDLGSNVIGNLHNRAGFGPVVSGYSGNDGNSSNGLTTLNGRPVLSADPANTNYLHRRVDNTLDRFGALSGCTMVFLVKSPDQTGGGTMMLGHVEAESTSGWHMTLARTGTNSLAFGGRRIRSDSYVGLDSGQDEGTDWELVIAEADYSNNALRLYKNGVLLTENTSAWGSGGLTAAANKLKDYGIGGRVDTATYRNEGWELAEHLLFTRTLDSTEKQQVEGYLAHAWGRTDLLPSDHPYKSVAPYLDGYTPAPSGAFQFSEGYSPNTSMQFED